MSLADSVIESFNGYEKAKAVLDNPNARLLHNVEGLEQRLYHLQGNDDLFYGRLDFQIRHAADAEIEAGKRLDNEEEH